MVRKINAAAAKKMLTRNKNIVVVDVRTEDEYAEDHVPGSILMPYDKTDIMAKYVLPDKNAVVFIGCSSGFRSGVASRRLNDIGYTNVYNVGKILDLK